MTHKGCQVVKPQKLNIIYQSIEQKNPKAGLYIYFNRMN